MHSIQTEEDHRAALIEIEMLWGAPKGTKRGDRLNTLLALVDTYEAKRWSLEADEG
jgi:HTH-type transcriptional regulator/antitoxin HigA